MTYSYALYGAVTAQREQFGLQSKSSNGAYMLGMFIPKFISLAKASFAVLQCNERNVVHQWMLFNETRSNIACRSYSNLQANPDFSASAGSSKVCDIFVTIHRILSHSDKVCDVIFSAALMTGM